MTIDKETYLATVTANEGSELGPGEIFVACVGLLGDEDSTLPMPVKPVFDWGWFYVPDVGEIVEIEVVSGTDQDESFGQASIDNLDITWRGKRVYGGEETDTEREINPDFTKEGSFPKRRGFATPAGHVFMFDDSEDNEQISLKWQNGKKGENCFFAMDKDGSIVLSNKTGTTLFLNAKDGEMSMIDQHGNVISSDSVGIKLLEKTGNTVELKEGAIIILGQSAVTVSCKDLVADAGNIELAGSLEAAILGTTFLTLFNAHIHPTGLGPSGPPTPPIPPTVLSLKVKLG